MPASYHRNADEMLFKTDNVCQKVDAKKQMLNTACREQISFTPAFISLLFLFSFHNKNVCFELKIKKKLIYFQFNEKENNFVFYFHFTFNSK